MASKSCGTCRDRRILCDRALPTCSQCSRSNRPCKGYELRLSWPNANDKRRAVVRKSSLFKRTNTTRQFSETLLVNVSHWDIDMHHYLSGLDVDYRKLVIRRPPRSFNPVHLGIEEHYLFQYFQYIGSSSLTTFGNDPMDMGKLLIRMALANNTPSATAIRQSLLAFSSLHRNRLQSQAAEFKVSAIRALGDATKREIGTMEAFQHVAAGMLLCSFEIHQTSCTSNQWKPFLDGAQGIIQAFSLSAVDQDSELGILLDWVYYHDVLSTFSVLHWQPRPMGIKLFPADNLTMKMGQSTPSSFSAALKLFSDVCSAVASKPPETMSAQELSDYKKFLNVLGWRIRTLPTVIEDSHTHISTTTTMELFQLAMLVYLNRATKNLLETGDKTQERVERGLSILFKLGSCKPQFPLFILGCEAKTDLERCTVLELMAKTETMASSRSHFYIKRLIQAIWVQDDLANGGLDYMVKLSAIISSCTILPSFV
ncbi:fungal-specific transcription factor domain-containing protein [Talaromyces proteolyticus]|uniref:Fungal-specific transcription factor domain-containing protein n=1 Tax=Talaromyces proteolyticus TaxID=1131652 RepID=A0AAD4Q084_9EURO|nr:fungal-specific transcription factor domain-containing protein [Talaromyces proteolyticus]KAH8697006.1 fungal-specific transcription factor domain-containing protein [Talaromyces proteolyticus]